MPPKKLQLDIIVPPISTSSTGNSCSIVVVKGESNNTQVIHVPSGTTLNREQEKLEATIEFTGEILGHGAGGQVRKARHKETNTPLAVKKVRIDTKERRSQLLSDIQMYQKFPDSDYLVHFYGSYIEQNEINIVLEYMDLGSLTNLQKHAKQCGSQNFPFPMVAWIADQTLRGLQTLHQLKVVHRDIKPENILLNHLGDIKLADFGISKSISEDANCLKTYIGTGSYMAPERIQGGQYSYNVDIWSLGLTLLECITGKNPIGGCKSFAELLMKITSAIDIQKCLADANILEPNLDFIEFISKMVDQSPEKRYNADQLLEMPFLQTRCSKDEFVLWIAQTLKKK